MSPAPDIRFDFAIEGELHDESFLDTYEVSLMFSQTERELGEALALKLEGLICSEHGQVARLTVRGRYHAASDEMDVQYDLEPCCPLFMARVIKTLNTVS
ncbi:MAG: hypothetical protein NZ750_05015 [Anaerolineae bacterium]|nr:hypothetical protein [Anaerolineae bacterium]MDW8172138.1 hypothetical protein [Anaerolineae bacterium]